jgi:head-tail adaptor
MADGVRENETVMFEFRAGADIKQGDRLAWQGTEYLVQAVSPLDAKRRFIEVRGQAIQAGETWAA